MINESPIFGTNFKKTAEAALEKAKKLEKTRLESGNWHWVTCADGKRLTKKK